ncbi:hypothetical protein ACFWBI_32695 [Streptomyces sp. NPDC059982]|uniref:hypothetical protein n=1 Tax=unclassified Streptomyces TaxID=2593676 RepID=UPI0036C5372E
MPHPSRGRPDPRPPLPGTRTGGAARGRAQHSPAVDGVHRLPQPVGRLYPDVDLRSAQPGLPSDVAPGRGPEMWVHLTVEEADIWCRAPAPAGPVVHDGRFLAPCGLPDHA